MSDHSKDFRRFLTTQAIEISEHAWHHARTQTWALIDFAISHAHRYRTAFENHKDALIAHCDSHCGEGNCPAGIDANGDLIGCPLMDGDHSILHELLGDGGEE